MSVTREEAFQAIERDLEDLEARQLFDPDSDRYTLEDDGEALYVQWSEPGEKPVVWVEYGTEESSSEEERASQEAEGRRLSR
jgi:hypothetical protein